MALLPLAATSRSLSLARSDGSFFHWTPWKRSTERHVFTDRGWRDLLEPGVQVSPQDDIIDDVESFVAAEILKERDAYRIYVMATHGIPVCRGPRLIEESSIEQVCLLSWRF